ncbi:site-specific integrase [Psychroflexus sp. YR1-1]|uniref:Site-specific integrase n=1 Tax=Psychroflexus aurantiacus TaxID=2709310 RepID=A0A6B3R9C1_9FLAO|nr:site-specific integrase [Psychroflexus aurantiacus]NEV94191.1 site-specific integrase [Psychroflexus aurantiacus]
MASVSYKIRERKDGSASIYLHFNYGKKKVVRYKMKISISNIKNWNKSNQRIKVNNDDREAVNKNKDLDEFKQYAEELIYQYEQNEIELDSERIKFDLSLFGKVSKRKKDKDKSTSFLKFYKWYVKYYLIHVKPGMSQSYSKESMKPIKTTIAKIEQYESIYGPLEFDDIDLLFHEQFINMLLDDGYSPNYIGNHIKNIKTIMNNAFERKYHKSLDYKTRSFTQPKGESDHIYLTHEEIEKIKNVDLSKQRNSDFLNRVRNLFLISCYSGLRVSDLLNLTADNIKTRKNDSGDEEEYFELKMIKTQSRIVIPIGSKISNVLSKYDNRIPPKVSSQKINKKIKDIAELAEVNDIVKIKSKKGREEVIERKPKHDLITIHTGRRSFCTNAYLDNVPVLAIMQATGHKSEKTFLKYIKASSKDHLNQLSKTGIF